MPSASAAARQRAASSGATGCAIETCATQPLPKNDEVRPTVRSTNWSATTKVPGDSSSLNEPQAETETRSVTPTCFSASMLAR